MFHQNKYTVWYYTIVNKAKSQERKKLSKNDEKYVYYENHHIIPKSMSGTDDKENLVLLTAKEHFIVHILLPKMCVSTKHIQQMINALNYMNCKCPNHDQRYFNSKLYEHYKKKIIYPEERRQKQKGLVVCKNKTTGEFFRVTKEEFRTNPDLVGVNYGRKPSKEWCENHSKNMLGENNPFYGKTHSKDTIEKIGKKVSKSLKGRPKTKEWKEKIKQSNIENRKKKKSLP